MRILNEEEKRNLLKDILIELSRDQEILRERQNRIDYYRRLEDVYYSSDADNFRHYYSDIFAVLTLIDGDQSIGNLEILAQNIQTIKDGYVPKNKDDNNELIDISKEIIKLYDHTNLDIGRINYTKRMSGETLSELSKTKLLIDSLEQKLRESEEERQTAIEALKKKEQELSAEVHDGQKKMQNEYITILGIFAAIVLAFTGGMTFSSSVLENLHRSSIYRILIVVCVLGFVIINLIWLLIDFVRDINGKSIRKWWLLILADGLLIASILFTCFAYKYDWFARESAMNESINQETEQDLEALPEQLEEPTP